MHNPNAGKVDRTKVWQILESIPHILDGIPEQAHLVLLQKVMDGEKFNVEEEYEKIIDGIYKDRLGQIIDQFDSCVER